MIVAIDPGKHAYGVALFDGRTLVAARYLTREALPAWVQDLKLEVQDELHLERQYLPKGHPRPMDIVDLAFAAGFAEGVCYPAKCVEHLPIRWKGNVPKPIMIRRIKAELSDNEIARIAVSGYKDHNTYDAIGIGLYALGRLR